MEAEKSKRFYVGSDDPVRRWDNLVKIADELFDGNRSAMINYAINKTFGLDPGTGERLPGAPVYRRNPEPVFLLKDEDPASSPPKKRKK